MRTPLTLLSGVMAVLPDHNVNTDSIIPSAWLRSATADLARGLFGARRFDESGRERPDFVLNQRPFRDAKFLLAGENFGCGSSREAAVWALARFGIRCVFAPAFADIFYENAFRNGVLAGLVDETTWLALAAAVERHRDAPLFHVDLPAATITDPDGIRHGFTVPAGRAEALIRGDDEIDLTLRHIDEIKRFLDTATAERGWLYRSPLDGPLEPQRTTP
ncbi:3-isopropylmalate/(R)-2-methylmalate dehydratase small subunit [Azospirillum oryzae]|uniref:3-isopropylmalate dehydratase n=1 Tax=Azospirillum oryzae TaxID=286727 RepID=A0A1X7HL02_9PROT|nr:3-isopropylmalate dehydratase small subunit [Azospirillum oryzae]SMF88612.1 3-isopropylmalate/(R)-2-methylmalate dehydratase small subunit [Azospirillum oryzae]